MKNPRPTELEALAARIAQDVLGPLVVGGALVPRKPIGARTALVLGVARGLTGFEEPLLSAVKTQRLRIARRLLPVDRLPEPDAAVWALAVALHDALQVVNPSLEGTLRPRMPLRLAVLVDGTLDRIAPPAHAADALARHTWLARLFELRRRDTTVSWWSGSAHFVGQPAPPRLLTWPDLRRVKVHTTQRGLADLAAGRTSEIDAAYQALLARLLAHTPLTDLASCLRSQPAFVWTTSTLALVATEAGLRLALRALDALPEDAVDTVLGRATRALVPARASRALGAAARLLAERSLARATRGVGEPGRGDENLKFARALGAVLARRALRSSTTPFLTPARLGPALAILEEEAHLGVAGDAVALLER